MMDKQFKLNYIVVHTLKILSQSFIPSTHKIITFFAKTHIFSKHMIKSKSRPMVVGHKAKTKQHACTSSSLMATTVSYLQAQ